MDELRTREVFSYNRRMGPRRPGRKLARRASVVALLLLGVAAVLARDELRTWYLLRTHFEKLGKNAQGYMEYRHRTTGIVFVLLQGATCEVGCTETEWKGFLRRAGGESFLSNNSELLTAEALDIVEDELRDEYSAGPLPRQTARVRPFLIAKFEVTEEAQERLTAGSPSGYTTRKGEAPAFCVGRESAREFCSRTGLSLPNEAQWEYAALGGTPRAEWIPPPIHRFAWHERNSSGDPQPVGTRRPNAFGIHDLFGNAWEWCLPETSRVLEPDRLVERGGCAWTLAAFCGLESRIVLDEHAIACWLCGTGLRPVFNLYER